MKIKMYKREDGSFGCRNRIAVISTVACANHVADLISREVELADAYTHAYGCDQLGPDLELSFEMLRKMGTHPNVGAVLVVGLGCEEIGARPLKEAIEKSGKWARMVIIQEDGGTTKTVELGVKICKEFEDILKKQERVEAGIDALTVAVECGGSDYSSGIAANPALGKLTEKLCDMGAKVIFGETTELMGAEHILNKLCETREISEFIESKIEVIEKVARDLRIDIRGSQPSPGNIEGGLSTIEEKSLGGVCKIGSSKIVAGLEFGETPTKPGVSFMNTPGNDLACNLGFAGGGAQIMFFTTGRGTPMGFASMPIIKVTANAHAARMMEENTDVDLSPIMRGEMTIEEGGKALFDAMMCHLSGEEVAAERLGHREFGLYRISPILT